MEDLHIPFSFHNDHWCRSKGYCSDNRGKKMLNHKGAAGTGCAFSIRDVELSFGKGHMVLKDVKVFNPRTSSELLKASNLTIQLNWQDFVLSQDKMVSVSADNRAS